MVNQTDKALSLPTELTLYGALAGQMREQETIGKGRGETQDMAASLLCCGLCFANIPGYPEGLQCTSMFSAPELGTSPAQGGVLRIWVGTTK